MDTRHRSDNALGLQASGIARPPTICRPIREVDLHQKNKDDEEDHEEKEEFVSPSRDYFRYESMPSEWWLAAEVTLTTRTAFDELVNVPAVPEHTHQQNLIGW